MSSLYRSKRSLVKAVKLEGRASCTNRKCNLAGPKGNGLWMALLFALMLASVNAQAGDAFCPGSVEVSQVIKVQPEGWDVAHRSSSHRLLYVAFYDGPIENAMTIVNDSESETKTKYYAIWHFGSRPAQRIWLACNYADTDVILSRRLEDKITECRVAFDRTKNIQGFRKIESVTCK